MELTNATREFITHWGEMGTRWGINRTVAQIHALLFISEAPLTADEISALSDRCDRLLTTARFPAPSGDMPAVPWPLF